MTRLIVSFNSFKWKKIDSIHTDCCHECFAWRTVYVYRQEHRQYKWRSIVCSKRPYAEFWNHLESRCFRYICSNVWTLSRDYLSFHRDLLHWMWWMLRRESNAQIWIPLNDLCLLLIYPRLGWPQWIRDLFEHYKTIISWISHSNTKKKLKLMTHKKRKKESYSILSRWFLFNPIMQLR